MTPPDTVSLARTGLALEYPWARSLVYLGLAWTALLALTFREWSEMAHQWWDIDTYAHILLVPPILAWLVWLRRAELANVVPEACAPGALAVAGGLALWLAGRSVEVNLVAHFGAVVAALGAVVALLGLHASLILAFPIAYALFLVPFGDEIVGPLQQVTARIAVGLTHASGVPAALHGLFIDTPAGRFVVAEECSGVKFLIAMIALGTLVAWTSFESWRRRAVFIAASAATAIVANGIRAWGTIYMAQYIGAERAGGLDHLIYGWVFFALITAVVLAGAWRFFEREPEDAGLNAGEAEAIAARLTWVAAPSNTGPALLAATIAVFAVLARLV